MVAIPRGCRKGVLSMSHRLLRRSVAVGVLCAIVCSISVNAQEMLSNGCRQYILEPTAPAGEMQRRFYVTAGAERFYVWSNPAGYADELLYLSVQVAGRPIVLGRYVKLGGKTVEIEFASSDESVVCPFLPGVFSVEGTGRAVLTVTIADTQAEIPVEIVPLPIDSNTKAVAIMQVLGVPDRVTKEYVPWPESRFVDNVFYGKRENGEGWRIHHWLYDAYPGLIIALDQDDIWARTLYNQSWEIVRQQWLEHNW